MEALESLHSAIPCHIRLTSLSMDKSPVTGAKLSVRAELLLTGTHK